jgi:hypothetical protein
MLYFRMFQPISIQNLIQTRDNAKLSLSELKSFKIIKRVQIMMNTSRKTNKRSHSAGIDEENNPNVSNKVENSSKKMKGNDSISEAESKPKPMPEVSSIFGPADVSSKASIIGLND